MADNKVILNGPMSILFLFTIIFIAYKDVKVCIGVLLTVAIILITYFDYVKYKSDETPKLNEIERKEMIYDVLQYDLKQ